MMIENEHLMKSKILQAPFLKLFMIEWIMFKILINSEWRKRDFCAESCLTSERYEAMMLM
jgi:hypothetical protein